MSLKRRLCLLLATFALGRIILHGCCCLQNKDRTFYLAGIRRAIAEPTHRVARLLHRSKRRF